MKYLSVFLSGVVTTFIVLTELTILQEGRPTATSKWAFDLYRAKERHANLEGSPKILIVAGSNSLFGINSKAFADTYNVPATNLGVHAGLGLKYILERSKISSRKGDIIYLPLEYALYQQDLVPSSQLMDFLLARDPDYLHSLSLLERISGYSNVSLQRISEGLRAGADNYPKNASKVYHVDNIDSSGNQLNNSVLHASEYTEKLSLLEPKDIGSGEISAYSKKILIEYIEWAKSVDICIIAAPPNLMKMEEYNSDSFRTFFNNIKSFYHEQGVVFSGDPRRYLFPKELFFDTEYHLNKNGVEFRTLMSIKDLGPDLQSNC